MTLVELRGGLIVRADALELGVRLEMAGGTWTVVEDKLRVTGVALTVADRAAIRALKEHLKALVLYRVPEGD